MVTAYHTLSHGGRSLYKEKGSKFIAVAVPVESEEAVKKHLEELRKEFYDARHHCYAYMLGAERKVFRANDDGEPNHSAGDPILGQINSKELTNILVVVIRYFGGTKLGVSGLITAYKTSAEAAINAATIVTKEVQQSFELQYGYDITNEVMRIISDLEIEIEHQDFAESCSLSGKLKIDRKTLIRERVQLLQDMGNTLSLKMD